MFRSAVPLVLSALLVASCGTTPSPSPGSTAASVATSPSTVGAACRDEVPDGRPDPLAVAHVERQCVAVTFDTGREIVPKFATGRDHLPRHGRRRTLSWSHSTMAVT